MKGKDPKSEERVETLDLAPPEPRTPWRRRIGTFCVDVAAHVFAMVILPLALSAMVWVFYAKGCAGRP